MSFRHTLENAPKLKTWNEKFSDLLQKCSENLSTLQKKNEESYNNKILDANKKIDDDDFINDNNFLIKKYFSSVEKKAVRSLLLSEGVRLDGRSEDQIRPIWCEIDYLPSVHGSAIFTRGETQSLSTVTLGTALDVNRIDNVTHQGSEKFYLHYNFPPFSTGEARPIRGVSRREIGHGNLAQRALKIVIPENFKTLVKDFIDDLTNVFPEYDFYWSKWGNTDITNEELKELFFDGLGGG